MYSLNIIFECLQFQDQLLRVVSKNLTTQYTSRGIDYFPYDIAYNSEWITTRQRRVESLYITGVYHKTLISIYIVVIYIFSHDAEATNAICPTETMEMNSF